MTTPKRLLPMWVALTTILCSTMIVIARPLPTDPNIKTGKLGNGVTWHYRQHDNPPGKMWVLARVDSGSLNETEQQRGLAHFIEHMAFNGSEHFEPGTLIPYFESIGMEFGADVNAFTSFDQTAYMLFLPDTTAPQIDKGMMVLSDQVFRAYMLQNEIDKERGVVLEESRAGKSAFQRVRDKLWPELFEGSRFAERLPIGSEDIISSANKPEFVDYYRTWYRPKNVDVFIVGNADVATVTPAIEKWFGKEKAGLPARTAKGPEFKPFTKQRAIVVTDAEMPVCDVEMTNILPARPATTTTQLWRQELVESIDSWLIGRRFEEKVNSGHAKYRSASASVDSFFQDAILVSGSATGEPTDWEVMLEQLIVEVNRAMQFGFTPREYELAKKELLADAERAVKTEPTANSRQFAFGMLFNRSNDEPTMSAQQKLDLHKEFLPSITLAELNESFKNNFSPGTFAYVVTITDKEGTTVPSRDQVFAAAKNAWAKKVKPLESKSAPTELLAAMPTSGRIVDSATDAQLGITNAWLSNNVRIHHRFMDYKKDTVLVTVHLAGGSLEETKDNVGVTAAAGLAFGEPATSRLTSTNVRDIMTGKNISVRQARGGDIFGASISGSPDDLETGLKLVHAILTDGKIEQAVFDNWKKSTLQQIDMFEKMPRFVGMISMFNLLSGDDPRTPFPTRESVNSQTLAKAQARFDQLRKHAPIEVSIVGQIDKDTALELATRYLGSLPSRPRNADYLNKLRKLARPTGPLTRDVTVDTVTPQAMAFAGFVGCEGRNVDDRRALQVAGNILSSQLIKRVREELSIVYSISARSNASWVYADTGIFSAGAPCDPDNAKKVNDEVHSLLAKFAKDGPTKEELDNAKKQIANNLDTQMREPRYWSSFLSDFSLHGRSLDEVKTEKAAFEKLTDAQVKRVFKKYYTPQRQFRVTALPKSTEGKTDKK